MKAVVVEIERNQAIVLNKQGEFIRIPNAGGLTVGSEVTVTKKASSIHLYAKIASIAAIFLVVLGMGFAAYSYTTPYSYIEVDINPSVELTVNVFDRIIKVEALNEDGKDILNKSKLNNKSVEEGVQYILASAEKSGYLKNESTSAVLLTVSSKDKGKSDQVEEKLRNAAASKLEEFSIPTDLVIQDMPIKEHKEAKKQDVPPGKLKLIEKLNEGNPDIKVDDYKDKTVKEILKDFKEKATNGITHSNENVNETENSGNNENSNGNNNNNNNKNNSNNNNSNNNNSNNVNTGNNNNQGKKPTATNEKIGVTPSPKAVTMYPETASPVPAAAEPTKSGNRFGQTKEKLTSNKNNKSKKKVTIWEFVKVSVGPVIKSSPTLAVTPSKSITTPYSSLKDKLEDKNKENSNNNGKGNGKNNSYNEDKGKQNNKSNGNNRKK